MSKHIFEQTIEGKKYEVQVGWDKPTRQYYGLILEWSHDPLSQDGGYYDDLVWCNLHTPEVCYLLDGIEREITQRGFTIPAGLFDNVRQDRKNNIVNQIRFYDTKQAVAQSPTIAPPTL